MSRGWDEARTPDPSTSASGPDPRARDQQRGFSEPNRPGVEREFDARQPARSRDRWHTLSETEWDILRTVGTFRVVAETDVTGEARDAQSAERQPTHLVEEGLLERRTAIVSHEPMHLLTLTDEGRSLLELHRETPVGERAQAYHTGVVKPRELGHDVQLYRAYRAEVARLHADGAKVTRVVLDYELKRDYQRFLQRRDREVGASISTDREAFARVHDLPIVDDHLELPDLRLEVEYPDGRRSVRDVEIVTEHYSRGQVAGKVRAGFSCYRPARTSFGRGTSRGAVPLDSDRLVSLE